MRGVVLCDIPIHDSKSSFKRTGSPYKVSIHNRYSGAAVLEHRGVLERFLRTGFSYGSGEEKILGSEAVGNARKVHKAAGKLLRRLLTTLSATYIVNDIRCVGEKVWRGFLGGGAGSGTRTTSSFTQDMGVALWLQKPFWRSDLYGNVEVVWNEPTEAMVQWAVELGLRFAVTTLRLIGEHITPVVVDQKGSGWGYASVEGGGALLSTEVTAEICGKVGKSVEKLRAGGADGAEAILAKLEAQIGSPAASSGDDAGAVGKMDVDSEEGSSASPWVAITPDGGADNISLSSADAHVETKNDFLRAFARLLVLKGLFGIGGDGGGETEVLDNPSFPAQHAMLQSNAFARADMCLSLTKALFRGGHSLWADEVGDGAGDPRGGEMRTARALVNRKCFPHLFSPMMLAFRMVLEKDTLVSNCAVDTVSGSPELDGGGDLKGPPQGGGSVNGANVVMKDNFVGEGGGAGSGAAGVVNGGNGAAAGKALSTTTNPNVTRKHLRCVNEIIGSSVPCASGRRGFLTASGDGKF